MWRLCAVLLLLSCTSKKILYTVWHIADLGKHCGSCKKAIKWTSHTWEREIERENSKVIFGQTIVGYIYNNSISAFQSHRSCLMTLLLKQRNWCVQPDPPWTDMMWALRMIQMEVDLHGNDTTCNVCNIWCMRWWRHAYFHQAHNKRVIRPIKHVNSPSGTCIAGTMVMMMESLQGELQLWLHLYLPTGTLQK